MQKVVLATSNQGKVEEMHSILSALNFEVVPQSEFDIPDAIEDGLSFVENALIKARHASELSGLPAIADDSGLEVEALKGAPGIYSSRYSGQGDAANNLKLLKSLHGIENRRARFQCVIVYLRHPHDPVPLIAQGTWQGEIAREPAGQFGFGYDPIFYIPELNCHSAELKPEAKKQLSHRGKALLEFEKQLVNL